MNHLPTAAITAFAALLGGSALAQAASKPALAGGHFTGEKLASLARVSLTQARTIALKAHPGEITDQELEKEAGGSGLRYSFDIKSQGKTFEVGVDAKSGKVLENAAEGAHPD